MTIMAIETTSNVCGVCILTDGVVIALIETAEPNIHDVQLARATTEALQTAALTFDDIDVVAVSAGPGSFTGTRVGVSFAKGLTLTGSPRLIGVSTLESIACGASLNATNFPSEFVASIEGHAGTIFWQKFLLPARGAWQPLTDLAISNSNEVALSPSRPVAPFSALSPNGPVAKFSAEYVARTAAQMIDAKHPYDDALTYQPNYVAEFVGWLRQKK